MAGGMYPISSSPFGEFWNLGVNFLHIVNFEFQLLFVLFEMAEEKKELDERILLVLLPIMLLQKTF